MNTAIGVQCRTIREIIGRTKLFCRDCMRKGVTQLLKTSIPTFLASNSIPKPILGPLFSSPSSRKSSFAAGRYIHSWTMPSAQDAEVTRSTEPLLLPGGAPLKVRNSLSKEKEIFKPAHETEVTWYSCGPTVYDSSHLGHARNYVSMDIIRRIMEGYFGYKVRFVQNVTDIDDKIIIRARQNYIWNEYLKSKPSIEDVQSKVIDAWKIYARKIASEASIAQYDLKDDFTTFVEKYATVEAQEDEKFSMNVTALKNARSAILGKDPKTYFENVKDVYLPILDKEVIFRFRSCLTSQQGAHFTEHSIFKQFTTFWENDYNQDMSQLNVLKPTQVIRVSDVVPDIVTFVQKIIDRGTAYPTSEGDVYFDVRQFQESGHKYAKLKPSNAGDTEKLLAEGEGSLSVGKAKRSNVDFALWKSSKPGEPRWPSPWGDVSTHLKSCANR